MIRPIVATILLAGLSACTTLPDWMMSSGFLSLVDNPGAGHYSFEWQLSGDRQVAPVQVFDNTHRTWLQFLPGQPVPAIFSRSRNGEQLLTYSRQGDYLILDGTWPELSFRGGALLAYAKKRQGNESVSSRETFPGSGVPEDTSVITISPVETAALESESIPLMIEHSTDPTVVKGSDAPEHVDWTQGAKAEDSGVENTEIEGARAEAVAVEGAAIQDAEVMSGLLDTPRIHPDFETESFTRGSFKSATQDFPVQGSYRITLKDQTFRQALLRWARQANWAFTPEHWAVDIDIPVSGEASFVGPFQDAVQDLLSATEMAERPLRPCFYSNRVLRVVPYSQPCDRSGGAIES